MSGSSFGEIFKLTTWGESHGDAIGCVIEGVPSGIKLTENCIQNYLDKRKPGQSKFTTQRKEPDKIKILSGLFENTTTGTPLSMVIYNVDKKSKDYKDISESFRPGHADYTYEKKFGLRDYRGGGRASARETAMRVAAGAIARKILSNKIKIRGALIQIGKIKINKKNWNWKEVTKNDFFSPDKHIVKIWEEYLLKVRKEGSSIGAIIEIRASNVPVGLGEPVFDKVDALIAKAMMSIPAVKGVEIGKGFESAEIRGEENVDEIYIKNNKVTFNSNNAGGTLGGITSGQDIVIRFAVKPTSSILKPKNTITKSGKETKIITKGRHDPCVGIRAVPVGEAMLAIVLADLFLRKKAMAK
ncbi:MAG: chorismate synthase [Rickettsiales bacterium]|nr:chorismate synthase [Rickettsiales bacterium]OUV52946.1 MAG: chorismate synthase [Rickettsiales bacterium TMED127]|tara:strand:+ start:47349 stop:48419 length:1071 start_codon:yes stop_codon:yes gene_type:complete